MSLTYNYFAKVRIIDYIERIVIYYILTERLRKCSKIDYLNVAKKGGPAIKHKVTQRKIMTINTLKKYC